jgi:hypothetical protein
MSKRDREEKMHNVYMQPNAVDKDLAMEAKRSRVDGKLKMTKKTEVDMKKIDEMIPLLSNPIYDRNINPMIAIELGVDITTHILDGPVHRLFSRYIRDIISRYSDLWSSDISDTEKIPLYWDDSEDLDISNVKNIPYGLKSIYFTVRQRVEFLSNQGVQKMFLDPENDDYNETAVDSKSREQKIFFVRIDKESYMRLFMNRRGPRP